MNWDVADFVIFGALLLGAGGLYTLLVRRTGNTAYRFAVGVAVAAAFMLVWINGAVGIIGDEGNPANLMYAGVFAVAFIGAIIARLEPMGMARALYATAIAQALVGLIALIAGLGSTGPIWPRDVLTLTAFFAVLWLISARLFQTAARMQRPADTALGD